MLFLRMRHGRVSSVIFLVVLMMSIAKSTKKILEFSYFLAIFSTQTQVFAFFSDFW
jgi:hypothetical protein